MFPLFLYFSLNEHILGGDTPCFRPICLGEGEDLSLDLTERSGEVAGWGATEVDYAHTQCGYKIGVTNPDSGSRVLKKLPGLRSHTGNIIFLSFNKISQISVSGRLLQDV